MHYLSIPQPSYSESTTFTLHGSLAKVASLFGQSSHREILPHQHVEIASDAGGQVIVCLKKLAWRRRAWSTQPTN
jgi:hypothetical protein